MKKAHVALMALFTIVDAASAQSSITAYGIADVYFSESTGGKNGSVAGIYSGGEQASRIGFKGVEDLGDGMSALFQLEAGINMNDGTEGQGERAFGRQAMVGLSSDYGTLSLGRQYNPFFWDLYYVDPMISDFAGADFNLFATYNFWTDNSVEYTTRNLNGFVGSVIYGFGGVAGNTRANSQYGGTGKYINGPLMVLMDYFEVNDPLGTSEESTTMAGGTYDFGVIKTYFAYSINKSHGAAYTQNNTDALIGISIPFGVQTFMASYINQVDKSGAAASLAARQFALAYTYRFSKRTDIYLSWAAINSADNNPDPFTTATGNGDREFQLGIHHKF